MKKQGWLAMILAILMLLLTGCGSKEEPTTTKQPTQIASPQAGEMEIETDPETGIQFVKNELILIAKEGVPFEQVEGFLKPLGLSKQIIKIVDYDQSQRKIVIYGESDVSALSTLRREAEEMFELGKDLFDSITPNYISEVKASDLIDPKTVVFTWEDERGYKYRGVLEYSPWILQSDKETINSYVNRHGFSVQGVPSIESWNISSVGSSLLRSTDGSYPYQFLVPEMNDMYYCLGKFWIDNQTEGWNITEDNIASPIICVKFTANNMGKTDGVYEDYSHYTAITTRVYYGEKNIERDGYLEFTPKMISNSWGPVYFVIAHAESKTPNNPDGLFKEYVDSTSGEIYLANVIFPGNKLENVSPFEINLFN